jgi:hypothetical protein
MFFTSLRSFPKIQSIIPAENFNDIITMMIDEVILSQPFEAFTSDQRKTISKFLKTLVKDRCPAAIEKLAPIVHSLSRVIAQPLEPEDLPFDTAFSHAYEGVTLLLASGK